MTKKLLIAAALMGMMGLNAVDAQAQGLVSLNFGAGPTLPIGEGKDTGVHANVGVGLGLGLLPLRLRVEGMLQRIPEGNDHHDFMGGSLNAEIGLPLPLVRPYLIGGIGLVRHEEHHGDHTHGAHTDMSFNVGAGTQVGLGRLNLYVEARYHRLREEGGQAHGAADHAGNTFVPVTFGVRF